MAGWARPVRMAAKSSCACSTVAFIFDSASAVIWAITVIPSRVVMACISTGISEETTGRAHGTPAPASVRGGRGRNPLGESADRGADGFPGDRPGNVALGVEVEEDHPQLVVAGQADGGGVGDLEVAAEVLVEAERV